MAHIKKQNKTKLNALGSFKVWFNSVTQLRLTVCEPMDCSMPVFPVHHQLPELAQIHGIAEATILLYEDWERSNLCVN